MPMPERVSWVIAAMVAIAGCDTVPVPPPPAPETIRYATSPCSGTCPVYTVTVSSDGVGLFEGTRFTAVTGPRHFTLTPAQFADFRARLAAVRPVGERLLQPPNCNGRVAPDLSGVDLRWMSVARNDRLAVNYGCDRATNAALFDLLRAAPLALPIATFIGTR